MSQALQLLRDGVAAAKAGNKVRARQLIRQVVDLEPRHETAWLWLAGLAESPLESVHFLEKVLEINPLHEKALGAIRAARVQAGIAAARAQDRSQARTLLRRAVDSDPGNEMAWLWLASVAETVEEGVRYLEKVLQVNPANERARAGLERYRGQLALRNSAPAPEPPAAPLAAVSEAKQPAAPTPPAVAQPSPQEVAESPSPHEVGSPKVESPPPHEEGSRESEIEETWECPFCQAVASGAVERCGSCGAILTLEQPEPFFRPLRLDHEKINAALEQLEQVDPASDFATAWQMGLAYLNLKQHEVGLELLQTATQLQPDDADFAAQVEALLQYRNSLTPNRAAQGRRKTILVVDDSPTIRKLVTMTVERRGYATRMAGTGYEAIDVIRDHGVPDLILLDITMPGMDGYQLCKLLRQNADTTNIPIVMLSGKDGFFNRIRGRMAGSTEYITKPFELEGLLRVVERHCALPEPAAAGLRPAALLKQ